MQYRLLIVLLLFLAGCSSSAKGTGYPVPDVDIRLPVVTCADLDTSTGYHVTVDGTSAGDGSLENPWDLDTALRHPGVVLPGDTIWVHGGTYRGAWVAKLDGAEGQPVIVSAWPGDRVTLDNVGEDDPVLQIYHSWSVFRGLELTNSSPDRRSARPTGIWAGGDHISLQNLIVHDVGVGISGGQLTDDVQEGTFVELHGCLFYNNGWLDTDRGHGHHVYLTNRDSRMLLEENMFFSAYGFGIHEYSETDRNWVQGFDYIGNVWFLNGAPGKKLVDGCLVGHNGSHPVDAITLRENMGWAPNHSDRDTRLGWSAPENGSVSLEDNYLVGSTIFLDEWDSITMEGNTFIGAVEGVDPADHPDNTYSEGDPTENVVFIRPNRYEPGRAHIVVYNWEDLDSVNVDLSGVLEPGAPYIIRDAQNFFGGPIANGVYDGAEVTLMMNLLMPVTPVGEPDDIAWSTGNAFNVFVLISDPCDLGSL